MRHVNRWLAVAAVVWLSCTSVGVRAATLTAKLESQRKRVVIDIDGKRFTCYKYGPLQKLPYFWPLISPVSGRSVTTETSWPYPHHHSLFFGCDRVNGGNYWQDLNSRGQILSQGPKVTTSEGDYVTFTDTCLWKQPGKDPVIRDERTVTISAPSSKLRVIDFEITLNPLTDIRIEKTNHSFFSGRMVPELSVQEGGTLVNAEGKLGEKGTWGQPSPWCDYGGTREGITEGMAIFQHPKNRWYPSKWFTRDYGFFSPTPMYWPEGQATELPKGQPLTLRYRVIVHAGNAEQAHIARLFAEYKAQAEGTGS